MVRIQTEYCLRCKNIKLRILQESTDQITFYSCPNCHRHYAKKPGQSLHDRWLSPISIVLYPIIFNLNPQTRAKDIANLLKKQKSREELKILINEIIDELTHPKQKLKKILDLKASEQDIREYLKLLSEELNHITQ
ncbi:MAG: hypothetical protein ACFFDI_13015 [Promethearchaeota archaeon]